MSASGRATEFMRAWGEGHKKPHNPDHRQWGAGECDACMAEAYEPWEALVHAAWILGWGPRNSDPAGPDTGVADSDRGSSSGTNLRPGGEPSPSRQGRARPGGADQPGNETACFCHGQGQFLPHERGLPAAYGPPPTSPALVAGVRPGAGGQPSGQTNP